MARRRSPNSRLLRNSPTDSSPTVVGPSTTGSTCTAARSVAVRNDRPGTVTAAGWITLVVSGLSAILYGFLTLAMIVAKDDVLREIDKALAEQGSTGDFDAESAFGVVVGVLVVVIVWCLIACVLAMFVLRRSNAARITLVVSAVVAGLLSLLGIGSVVSAIPLLACLATVVLLFTGGAGDWFAGRARY